MNEWARMSVGYLRDRLRHNCHDLLLCLPLRLEYSALNVVLDQVTVGLTRHRSHSEKPRDISKRLKTQSLDDFRRRGFHSTEQENNSHCVSPSRHTEGSDYVEIDRSQLLLLGVFLRVEDGRAVPGVCVATLRAVHDCRGTESIVLHVHGTRFQMAHLGERGLL